MPDPADDSLHGRLKISELQQKIKKIEEIHSKSHAVPEELEETEPSADAPLLPVIEKSVMLDKLSEVSRALDECQQLSASEEMRRAKIAAELKPIKTKLRDIEKVVERLTQRERGIWYRWTQLIYRFFRIQTKIQKKYQKDVETMEELRKQAELKERLLDEINATLIETSQKIKVLSVERSELKKDIGRSTKEEIDLLMLQLIFRKKMLELEKLIKKCEQFHLDYVGKHLVEVRLAAQKVRVALKYFLEEPTKNRLDELNQTLESNPMYSKSFALYQLVKNSSIFYPEIRMTKEKLIPMRPVILDPETTQNIAKHKAELNALKHKLGETQSIFRSRAGLFLKAVQNKEALENALIAVAVLRKQRDLFAQNSSLEQLIKQNADTGSSINKTKIEHKIEKIQQIIGKYDQKIGQIEAVVGHIRNNLSKKNNKEVSRKFLKKIKQYQEKKVIDPFVEGKRQADRLELTQLLNQVAIASLQIEEGESSIEIDISYVVDSELKNLIVPEDAAKKIEEYDALREKISVLEAQTKTLEEDAVNAVNVSQATELNGLIEECRKQTVLNNPITKALGRFLMIPTENNLSTLISKIKKDESYIKNKKLLPILAKASELFPSLKEHIVISSKHATLKSNDTAHQFKESLSAMIPCMTQEPLDETIKGRVRRR